MVVSSGWCSPNLYIGKWVGKSPNLHPLENGLFRVPGIHVVEASKLSTFGYVVVMIEVVGSMSLPPTLMGVKDVPETSFGGETTSKRKNEGLETQRVNELLVQIISVLILFLRLLCWSLKLTNTLKMYLLLKVTIFHCHVCFRVI